MNQGTRRRGREMALKIIYSLPDLEAGIDAVLEDFWGHFRFREDVLGEPLDAADEPVPPVVRKFADELARGVAEHLDEIDAAITRHSTNWALERMARVDLSLLRMATFELLFRPDVPASVAINEAIEIGKRYGTRETPAFVNGILDKISRINKPSAK